MNTTKKTNNLMKGMINIIKRVKWENIHLLWSIPFGLYCIYTHILNGASDMIIYEFFIYIGCMSFGMKYLIKDIRKNFIEYTKIFFE